MCEWISVKDRLPEECEDVLLYAEWESAGISGVSHNSGVKIGWRCGDRWHIDGKCRVKATHWLPLPSLRKEDQ